MEKISFDFDSIDLATVIEEKVIEHPEATEPEAIPTEAKEDTQKPLFRQSSVQHYFKCPRKYKLYLTYKDFVEDRMAMRKGRIFETHVFGHKPGDDVEDYQKSTIGKITAPTIKQIALQAEKAKKIFTVGDPFVKLKVEMDKFTAQGELDFLGRGYFEGEEIEAIWDLKYTANIDEFWNKKQRKEEFLQGIWYPWMLFQTTGKLLPFIYVIVESTYDDPLIKMIRVDVKENDFLWLIHQLNTVANDYFFEANVGEGCMGYRGFGKCSMLEWCAEGREYIEQTIDIRFEDLLNAE